jgi:hypothetical protein
MAAVFLLVVGCLWALSVLWMFLAIAGIADMPKSLTMPALWLCGMLLGPLTVIIGSVVLLRRTSSRRGSTLVTLGCLIFTGFALHNSIAGMQRVPLQAPTPYRVFVVLLLVMLLADGAAYKIFRANLWKSN